MLDEGNSARKSLGRGVVLLALAAGFVGAGFMINGIDGDSHAVYAMGIPAVILAAVGAAYLLLAVIDFATRKKT
jgi:drug/metabolite transporter (DMT)-like permease